MVASQSTVRSWWSPPCRGPWATVSLNGYGRVSVRTSAVEAVKALNRVLVAYRYGTRSADTGAYNCRRVTGGTTYSLHAYGIAIDLNWQTNPYSRYLRTDMLRYGDGRMPNRIQAIRTNNGRQVWRWGGYFSGYKDAMHYEICCSPADLRTGINWSTVYGGGAAPAPRPVVVAPSNTRPTLRLGSTGTAVKELQYMLNAVTGSRLTGDGNFGPATYTAVVNFQRVFKLVADGIVGPKTWDVLTWVYVAKHG